MRLVWLCNATLRTLVLKKRSVVLALLKKNMFSFRDIARREKVSEQDGPATNGK